MKKTFLLLALLVCFTTQAQVEFNLLPSNMIKYIGKATPKDFEEAAGKPLITSTRSTGNVILGNSRTKFLYMFDSYGSLCELEILCVDNWKNYMDDFLSIKGIDKKTHVKEKRISQRLAEITIEFEGLGMQISEILSRCPRVYFYNYLVDIHEEYRKVIKREEQEIEQKKQEWIIREKELEIERQRIAEEERNTPERKARAGFFEPENIIPIVGRGTKQQFEKFFGTKPVDFRGDNVCYGNFEWPVNIKFSDNVVIFVSFRLFGNLGYEYLEKLHAANFKKQLTKNVTSFESGFGDFDIFDTKVDVYAVKDEISFIICEVYYSRQFMGFNFYRQPFAKK